jgi:hypothetical protein
MTRITDLRMTLQDILVKMSDGNPGAITALVEMVKASPTVDPESALGPLSAPLSLDTHQIYGPDIWVLYSDICRKDAASTLALLRAVQLGILAENKLKHAITKQFQHELDVPALHAAVCDRLSEFQKPATQQ